MFPNLLPVVTFTTFIGTGHTLDSDIAVASLVVFSLMQGPLIELPFFFSSLINLAVSMRRIEGFMDLNEV